MKRVIIIVTLVVIIAAAIIPALLQIRLYKNATSIYFKPEMASELMKVYDRELADWPIDYMEHDVTTDYGTVHVIECGNQDGEPLVLFHAASVGAISWKKNVETLGETYHIFAIDTLGEANKSHLDDINHYPSDESKMVSLYHEVFEQLDIENPYIAGASYGGFIALNYAKNYPDEIKKIALIGPMGISKSVGKTIAIMTLYTFYPYEIFTEPIVNWSVGESDEVKDTVDYFSIILSSALGRYYRPSTLSETYLQDIKAETLLILGDADQLVGKPEDAADYASNIPDIQVRTFESGHLINVEQALKVNEALSEFFQ